MWFRKCFGRSSRKSSAEIEMMIVFTLSSPGWEWRMFLGPLLWSLDDVPVLMLHVLLQDVPGSPPQLSLHLQHQFDASLSAPDIVPHFSQYFQTCSGKLLHKRRQFTTALVMISARCSEHQTKWSKQDDDDELFHFAETFELIQVSLLRPIYEAMRMNVDRRSRSKILFVQQNMIREKL